MKKFRRQLLIGATSLALGVASVAAYANRPGCDGIGAGRGSAADHEKFAERMKQQIAKREAELHARLKLNASQEAAWNDYVAKMRPEAPPARPDRAELDKLSAPDRMEKILGFMKQREDRLAQRAAATRQFYAVLTPEQQKTFDEAFDHGRPRHGHRPGPR